MKLAQPEKFLEIVYHEPGDDIALCAGFERGDWRNDQFAKHLINWLPEFAFTYSELIKIASHNAVEMVMKAANIIYNTEKYGNRGEFGELLLHAAIRQIYNTEPAISKIYYKSGLNETVKGFDAVHVVEQNDELELWIGETKFYSDLSRAINDVCKEIIEHLETDYLRGEFILIANKIDSNWQHADLLKDLINKNKSLDEVFSKVCIPVLLTYNSKVVNEATKKDNKDGFPHSHPPSERDPQDT
ncbi:MAG: DUF1837 domain-containing protein [Moraxellaceae bacterium]|nr:MAG: DUF1837 domain-containing protein [Moraxellaceae bacterium]